MKACKNLKWRTFTACFSLFCSALLGWWTRWRHVSAGGLYQLCFAMFASLLWIWSINLNKGPRVMLNVWWGEISIICGRFICVWSSFAGKNALLWIWVAGWAFVCKHESGSVCLHTKRTECDPPAVLIQTHTYNTDGVMTFCTSDSCGVFPSLKLIWVSYNTWVGVTAEGNTKCEQCFWSLGSVHIFYKSVHISSISSVKHNKILL